MLSIIDATANTLKNFSLELPLKKFVSITGPSGSGKTTLLRDIIYAEWKRRITNDSTISSQVIRGLPPVFYFGNQRAPRSKESILDGLGGAAYLFELGLRIGIPQCVSCQETLHYESLGSLYSRLSQLIGATVVVGIPLTEEEITENKLDLRVIFSGQVLMRSSLDEEQIVAGIPRAVDSIKIIDSSKSRLLELLKHAQELAGSKLFIVIDGQLELVYLVPTCSDCGREQRPISRALFEAEGFLAPEIANLRLSQKTILSLLSLPLDELSTELALLGALGGTNQEILKVFQRLVACACELGLTYLALDRKLRTLSSGEFQRVNLASVLVEQVYGSLIALDEPSSGLSPSDTKKLSRLLSNVTLEGNSVLVATHSRELIEAADKVFNLQGDFVESEFKFPTITKGVPTKFLQLSGVNLNNLVELDCKIPLAALTCMYGISGSGKSTLALQVLLPLISKLIKERKAEVYLPVGRLSAPEQSVGRVVFFRASRFFSLRRAGVVSALGVVPGIRDLYLKTELARIRGLGVKDLNFYHLSPQTTEIRFKGVSFDELGKLSIDEALLLFDKIPIIKNKFKVVCTV